MIPDHPALKFEFQLGYHGRLKFKEFFELETQFLTHARYILNNALRLKAQPELRDKIKHFCVSSYIWTKRKDLV